MSDGKAVDHQILFPFKMGFLKKTIQEQRKGPSSPETVTKITGIWLVGYISCYYAGPFVAGVLTDNLTYSSE